MPTAASNDRLEMACRTGQRRSRPGEDRQQDHHSHCKIRKEAGPRAGADHAGLVVGRQQLLPPEEKRCRGQRGDDPQRRPSSQSLFHETPHTSFIPAC